TQFVVRRERLRALIKWSIVAGKTGGGCMCVKPFVVSVVAIAAAAGAMQAAAQTWPARPVRVVVPFPPGGTPDIQMRILVENLTPRLNQPFVIDNRAGAAGNIGMEIGARAAADGYTLTIGTVGNWTVNPHLYKLSYDVVK